MLSHCAKDNRHREQRSQRRCNSHAHGYARGAWIGCHELVKERRAAPARRQPGTNAVRHRFNGIKHCARCWVLCNTRGSVLIRACRAMYGKIRRGQCTVHRAQSRRSTLSPLSCQLEMCVCVGQFYFTGVFFRTRRKAGHAAADIATCAHARCAMGVRGAMVQWGAGTVDAPVVPKDEHGRFTARLQIRPVLPPRPCRHAPPSNVDGPLHNHQRCDVHDF